MIGQQQLFSLFRGEATFHQCQVSILIVPIKLVTDDSVADMGQMNTDLVLSSRALSAEA
jgi:hypothetical protein